MFIAYSLLRYLKSNLEIWICISKNMRKSDHLILLRCVGKGGGVWGEDFNEEGLCDVAAVVSGI